MTVDFFLLVLYPVLLVLLGVDAYLLAGVASPKTPKPKTIGEDGIDNSPRFFRFSSWKLFSANNVDILKLK